MCGCVCVCVCVKRLNRRKTSIAISVAGGAGGTDETGTSKDTPQMPVISMGTLIDDTDVPAFWYYLTWQGAKRRTLCTLQLFLHRIVHAIWNLIHSFFGSIECWWLFDRVFGRDLTLQILINCKLLPGDRLWVKCLVRLHFDGMQFHNGSLQRSIVF